jgi:hypothetical protein
VEDRILYRATVRILPAQLTACALFTAVQVHTAGVAAGRENGLPVASSKACTCRRCTRGRMDSYASPEGQGWPGLGALRASLSDAEVGSPGGYPSPQALFQDPSPPHAPCGTPGSRAVWIKCVRCVDRMCSYTHTHTHIGTPGSRSAPEQPGTWPRRKADDDDSLTKTVGDAAARGDFLAVERLAIKLLSLARSHNAAGTHSQRVL